MRLSSKAHYAVRAILDLAQHQHQGPVSIQAIAQRQAISRPYLEQLFAKLRRGQVIRSIRGANGGYLLARPSDQVSLAEILDLVEEQLDPTPCFAGKRDCRSMAECKTRHIWRRFGEHVRLFLKSVTLEHLLIEDGRAPLTRKQP
jgi:Rrf2 family iron-sulfur cluster assembly transcriptional regulator